RLADLAYNIGDFNAAIEQYQAIAKIDAKDLAITRRLAESCSRAGKYDQAHAVIAQILAQNPEDLETLILQGFTFMSQSKFDEALAAYNHALKNQPNHAYALTLRAVVRLHTKRDMDQAIADLERALL